MEKIEKAPLVSVIMNCWNGEKYLKEAIDSVYAQDMNDWEIIFFDNCSTDRTAEIAQSYDGRLRYFRNDKTIPLGAARNAAIAHARGKYIAFLDCDDVCLPTRLSKQAASMEAPSSRPFGLGYSDSMRMDAKGNDIVPYSFERELYRGDAFLPMIRDCFIDMSTCMITAEAFRKTGGFHEPYKQVEDWDLWLKIARDHDVAFVNEILIKTRIHPTNESRQFHVHSGEKKHLITSLECRTPEEEQARKETLSDLVVRESLASLIASTQQGKGAVLKALAKTVGQCALNPGISYRLMRKYLNPRMLNVYRHKYLNP